MLDARVPPDITCAALAQVGWSTEDIQCLNDRRAATPLPCAREVADTDTGYGP